MWWYVKDIFLLIFISQNCKNIYWNLRKASVFQDLIAIKFHFKMDYDIHRQVTDNSLGSHEYRQLRQWWIIPSNLKSSASDTTEILQSLSLLPNITPLFRFILICNYTEPSKYDGKVCLQRLFPSYLFGEVTTWVKGK